jgi:hypothetical protein
VPPLRVAFDLDGTLIPEEFAFPTEAPARPLSWLAPEPLRLGAPRLLRDLRRSGREIWAYTTSLRSPRAIRWLFRCHGVRLDGVVNRETHERTPQYPRRCSKYPPAFGIGLLVDNDEGVAIEGAHYGFRVLIVAPGDPRWADAVRSAARCASGGRP